MPAPPAKRRRTLLWLVPAAVALAWMAAYVLAAAASGDDGLVLPRLPRWSFRLVSWTMALALAAGFAVRRPVRQALGLSLMTVPVTETLLGIVDSFGPLLAGGVVLRAYTTYQLSSLFSSKLLADLGYLGAGLLLWAPGRLLGHTPRSLAAHLRRRGLPLGGRSEGASALAGVLAFPLLLLGTVGIDLATRGVEALRQSDESSVFDNMTVYHAVLVSLAAAFGEELVYRGLVQGALSRRLPVAAAIAVQALFFGFAHSGYATWIHVLLPTLFGVVAGIAAWRFGIWSAIALHFLVDLYAFGAEAGGTAVLWTLSLLLLANVALSFGYGVWWTAGWVQARRKAMG